jgi:predicted O-linked N-acetylglucosamine transferase (SPINDLY family)
MAVIPVATIPEALALALQYHQAGRLPEAEALYRQILQVEPNHPEALHLLGVMAHQQGQHELAVDYIGRAIAIKANEARFHNNLGATYRALGKLQEAMTHYQTAIALHPAYAEAYNNLGNVLREQGKLDEAEAQYRQAVALRPDYAEAHHHLGNVLREQGKLDEAEAQYRQAVAIKPGLAEAFFNLGNVLKELQRPIEAEAQYRQALALQPGYAEAHNNVGSLLQEQGKLAEAEDQYRQAIALKSDYPEAHYNLGTVLKEHGRVDEAVAHYRQALALRPEFAEAYNNLGVALSDQGRGEEGMACYRRALAHKPDYFEAHYNLGNTLKELGRLEDAVSHFQQALAIRRDDGMRIKLATILPMIYESFQHLVDARRRYEEYLTALGNDDLTLTDPVRQVGQTSFYLAYHGFNDRDLQVQLARLYERACPSLLYVAPHCNVSTPRHPAPKIRVGFVSKYFHNHSVGFMMQGLLSHLSRQDFHVHILFVPPVKRDELSALIQQKADTMVILPTRLDAARQCIAALELDILCYPDIGMDPFTYFLAFSRLAPVQCVLIGHPVTTGIRNMDYFISSGHSEPEEGDSHYSERLVRFHRLPGYYYRRPTIPSSRARGDFGFDQGRTTYLCPQTLFKFHPDFDEFLAGILRADPNGQVAVVVAQHDHLTQLLMRRFQKAIPDVMHRIRFLPRQELSDFYQLLASVEVILDTLHFTGGTTSYMALAMGTPVVTLPGMFMRGRMTLGCYTQMGMTDCVVSTREEYVERAVRIGGDSAYREFVRSKILSANHVLYEDAAAVREFEQFFLQALSKAADYDYR